MLTLVEFHYKQLILLALAVTLMVFLYLKGAALSDATFGFLAKPRNDWIYALFSLLLCGLYFYNKTLFAGMTVGFLVLFFSLLSFQYGQVQAGDKDQTSKNRFFLFLIFVLPVFPLAKWVSALDTPRWGAFFLLFYFVWSLSFLLGNPNNVMSQKDYQTGIPYLLSITGFFLLLLIYIHANILQGTWENFYSMTGILFAAFLLLIVVFSQMTTVMTNDSKSNHTLLVWSLVLFGGMLLYALRNRQYFSKLNVVIKTLYVAYCWVGPVALLVVAFLVGLCVALYYLIEWIRNRKEGKTDQNLYRLNKVATFNPGKHFGYNYAISCWIFLKSQPPNETVNSSTFVNVLSYGGKPAVVYNGALNLLRVSMQDEEGANILVKDMPDVPLQTWNYFVFYYNNASLDVFCNAVLVASYAIVPKLEDNVITIGNLSGNRGKLTALTFHRGSKDPDTFLPVEAITMKEIQDVYRKHRGQDPPKL